ncbi:MAG: putative sulfate exporter family transporter [Roseivirga sp.]|nr:putative sulfate exporter family transporter [Roseivirga sp.]
MSIPARKVLFFVGAALCALPVISPPLALLIGFGHRNLFGESGFKDTSVITKRLLQVAVIGLGFCIDVEQAAASGTNSLLLIMCSVIMVLGLGLLLARWIGLERNLSFLISSGTAICGGSAIASVAPVMNVPVKDISVALSVVFILNAAAIFIFPGLGAALDMTQSQFGLWCAVAIHDTSSVVGAASVYGQQALELATTAKLARVLWIIPVMLILSLLNKRGKHMKFPWFVLFFVLAVVINYWLSIPDWLGTAIFQLSKTLMTIVLFLIGTTLGLTKLRTIGYKPLLFGTVLWVLVASSSAFLIISFF